MDDIISSAQLGFVPGRNITEATRLIKLAMALAEEEDEEGIMIAADWEKAFDRVSWEYLHDALRELGFGPRLREWVGTIYNSYSPPIRRVKANGERSPPFEVHSGTPQGCPASPLIFLLVAEALTRAVESDEHIQQYEDSTGMKANQKKFEGEYSVYPSGRNMTSRSSGWNCTRRRRPS